MLEKYGWTGFIYSGLYQIRTIFPQAGLTERNIDLDDVPDVPDVPESYPENISLYDFILNSGHQKVDMIKM